MGFHGIKNYLFVCVGLALSGFVHAEIINQTNNSGVAYTASGQEADATGIPKA